LHQVAPEGSVIWWLIGVPAMAAGEHERRSDKANTGTPTAALRVDPLYKLRAFMPDHSITRPLCVDY
jgi:hypothetical protein